MAIMYSTWTYVRSSHIYVYTVPHIFSEYIQYKIYKHLHICTRYYCMYILHTFFKFDRHKPHVKKSTDLTHL